MKIRLLRVLSFVLACMFLLQMPFVSRAKGMERVLFNAKYGDAIPIEVYQEIEMNEDNLLNLATTELTTIDIQNDLYLDKPFVIISVDKGIAQDHIYYFPIVNNQKIIILAYVIDINGECCSGLTSEFVKELNDESYRGQSQKKIVLKDDEKLRFVDEKDKVCFSKYMKLIKSVYSNNWNPSFQSFGVSGTAGFKVNHEYEVRLNFDGCQASQFNMQLCWAASISAVISYLNPTHFSGIDAMFIANNAGIGYSDGASVEKTCAVLNTYCSGYVCKKNVLSYSEYTSRIKKQSPMILNGCPTVSGAKQMDHMVTGMGYRQYGGYKQAIIYNSATQSFDTFAFNKTSYFVSGNVTYKYNRSIYR